MSESIVVERDRRVAMRDAVELATDIYRPADDRAHPVLVQRTPYSKDDAWVVGGLMFNPFAAVERGYAVVVQDCRGRFKSEGDWIPFVVEGPDGYDTIEWAAEQPWSSGRVGIYGSSYNGVTVLQAAVSAPPHLQACVAYMTGANYHDSWTYSGGAFELGFNLWWAVHQAWDLVGRLGLDETGQLEATARLSAAMTDAGREVRHRPIREIPAMQGGVAPYWAQWLDHPRYDEYWKQVDAVARAIEIRAPMLQISGWYDGFLRGHLDLHQALHVHPDARVRDGHELVIGPWDHLGYLGYRKTAAGQREFGPVAASGPALVTGLSLDFFDRWLCDREPAEPTPRVRYFQMGECEWKQATSWPPSHTAERYYLRSGGRANGRFGDGLLLGEQPAAEAPDSFVYDPEDPVPTVGGRSMAASWGEGGVQDQAEVEERSDVLVYTAPHLDAPLRVAGPVSLVLFASSSAPDTDFTGKLVDVELGGYCVPVAEGILRARYRNGSDREAWLLPGEVYELRIDLLAVAHTFELGHRLRIEVSSSNFPKYDRNPNGMGNPADAGPEAFCTAVQHVYHDAQHASFVALPVVESAAD